MKNDDIKKLSDKEIWDFFKGSTLENTPKICDELLRRIKNYNEEKLKELSYLAKSNIRKHTRACK